MRWIQSISAGVLLSLAACGQHPGAAPDPIDLEIAQLAATDPDTFVGQVGSSDTFVAVVRRGSEVRAYLCDGTAGGVTVAVWLEGTASGPTFSASSEDGRMRLEGTVDGSGLTVQISGLSAAGSGQVAQLSAAGLGAATHPAGLWTSFGGLDGFVEKRLPLEDLYRVGWIVLPDGRQRGAALKDSGPATTAPIDPQNPGVDTEGGFPVGSEPTPAGPADPGLCALYQGSYLGGKDVIKQQQRFGSVPPEKLKKAKEIMKNALTLWNAECKGTYGDINNENNGL